MPQVQPAYVPPKPTEIRVVDADFETRKMAREDDRLITLKLMDVYVDEKIGYKDQWTDGKVASDLGIPVEWVALVRDRSFGPETNAEMRDKQNKVLVDKMGEIERLIVLADKKLEQLQNLDNKVSDIFKQIESQIDRFDELTKSLETEDKHVENVVAQFSKAVAEYRAIALPMPLAS